MPGRRVIGHDYQPCSGGCGELATKGSRSGLCRACYNAKIANPANADLKIIPCKQCGEPFQQKPRAAGRPPQEFCSKHCVMIWRNAAGLLNGTPTLTPEERRRRDTQRGLGKARLRRMRLGAAAWDGVPDSVILERDGWVCQICGEPIVRALRYPDLGSRSVDHVVALALGGDDTAANKQAAHLGCNIRKGIGEAS